MKWTTKATAQQLLSVVPGSDALYYTLQRNMGRLRHYRIGEREQQGHKLLDAIHAQGIRMKGLHTVEIGTGWVPLLPLMFFLHGQERCDTYDISRLLRESLVLEAVGQLIESSESRLAHPVALCGNPLSEDRLLRLKELATAKCNAQDLLSRVGIHYHAPADAAKTGLPDASVDLVFSNVVLEHIPLEAVHTIFEEASRLLRPGGCMVHLIDLSDHFSHGLPDEEISATNFLQYSKKEFEKYNTKFMYQNRIRPATWRDIITQHGFHIEQWQTQVDSFSLERYSESKVDPEFARFSPEENCTRNVLVVASKLAKGHERFAASIADAVRS